MNHKFLTPILPDPAELPVENGEGLKERKEEEETVSGVLIKNVFLEEADLSQMRFSSVIFEGCSFQECCFDKGEFTDVRFRFCDISNCSFLDSYMNRVEFCDSKGVGVKLVGSTILHTLIGESNFAYSNFDASKLGYVHFEKSLLQGAFLTQCRCEHVKWSQVNLERASFFKTLLKGMDFTGSVIRGITLSDDCRELKGAVVDLYQAAELARYLGVIIKD